MAKNRNKNKRNDSVSMDIGEGIASDLPQAMDTSESGSKKPASGVLNRKIKGRPMKRTKSVRKNKAIAKAISKNEKSLEKIVKNETKTVRAQSAKILYE